jgi:hypothetical protein
MFEALHGFEAIVFVGFQISVWFDGTAAYWHVAFPGGLAMFCPMLLLSCYMLRHCAVCRYW